VKDTVLVALIAAAPAALGAFASFRNSGKIVEVKHELNSRLTESIRQAAEIGYAKGVQDERNRSTE
jgi:hypothetical protein